MVVFNRWNNKRYAVFNSLRRVIKIGTLSVAYLLFANTTKPFAQTADTLQVARNYELESVDVTAEQQPEIYSALSRVVLTITRAEIERAAVTSINELLEYASNIDIRHRGGNGMQADISIRGGSFDQVLVLLNGINITDPQTGHHNLNLPVNLSSVERIEILKGPGAWKFGPGAFSGAVNIITSSGSNNFLDVSIAGGQHLFNTQQVSAGIGSKKSSHLFSANRKSSDGYIDNTDFNYLNLFYNGKYHSKLGEFSLQGGITDKAFGANSFYTAMFPNQYEEIQTYFTSLSYKTNFRNVAIEPGFYYRRNNDRFLLFRDNPPAYANYHTSDVYGGNIMAAISHNSTGVTTAGAGIRSESIYSNNLGKPSDVVRYSTVNDTILLDKTHSRSNYSFYIGHKHYFNKLTANIGLNLTHNSDLPEKWFLFPGIDVQYNLDRKSAIQASINKTMRMPTFTDMYYTSPNNEGNSSLLPEEALGFEIAYNYKITEVDFSLTGFVMQGRNMIDWVRESTTEKWQTVNYAQMNTSGLEVALTLHLNEIFGERNPFETVKVNYTALNIDKEETELISNYSLNYLKNRLDVSLLHKVWRNVDAGWHVAYQHRNGMYEKIVNRESYGMIEYSPFFTADFKIMWQKNSWNIYASVNNLLDKEYFDIGNVPQPGRWVKAGIGKKINFR